MDGDSGNLKIGEVFQESYECEGITWKIPHVSSLDFTEKTKIRSPKFSYKNSTWIFKMYSYGRHGTDDKATLTLLIERLHSEIPDHSFCYTSYFKYRNAVNIICNYKSVEFHRQGNDCCLFGLFGKTWSSVYRNCRWKDTITLVVEILTEKDSKTKSAEVNLDPVSDEDSVSDEDAAESFKLIGEIFIESFDLSLIAWKIPKMHSISAEVDNSMQSPAFTVVGVPWILKLFPRGQTRFNSKGIDVVIEKLHSHIGNQTVLYNIVFNSYSENESLMKDYCSVATWIRGSFNFNSKQVQENVLEVSSYDHCLRCAASSPEIGSVVLKCAFRISKETETGLNFAMESLESFKESSEKSSGQMAMLIASTSNESSEESSGQVAISVASTSNDSMPLKTASIGNPEFGEIIKTPFVCEIICWTISSFSLLLDEESKSVKSPQFTYKGAIWILEIYPHCRYYPHAKDSMRIVMKRLYSQFSVHNFFCRICFENRNGQKFANHSNSFTFDSSHEERNLYQGSFFYYNIFSFYRDCRYHCSLKLVCELYNDKNFVTEVDNKAKSLEADLSNINADSDNSSTSVGELSTESFDVEMITWKIPKISSLPTEVDYGVQSPSFAFASASWILKMFPYGRKKFESEQNVDVVIERAFSLLPNHPVPYGISFTAYDKQVDEKGYSLKNCVKRLHWDASSSFIFDSNYSQENVCSVISYADLFMMATRNQAPDTVFLLCDFRIKNNVGVKLNIQTESAKSSVESCENMSKKKPVPIDFPFGALSKKKPEENTKSSASSSKEPFGKVSEQNPSKSPFSFTLGESFGNMSEQKPVPFKFGESLKTMSDQKLKGGVFNFTFKSTWENKFHQTPVSFASTSKGTSENKLDQTPVSFASTSKELSTTKSEQKPVPFNFGFKDCVNVLSESGDLPNKKLLQDFKELFLNQEDCDVILNVKGREFAAHRIILKARSPVFASTFRNDMKEKVTGVVDIEDCDPSSFSDFLYFLYCGSVEKLSSENVFSLFTAADKYDVQDLRSECLKFMKKNLSVDTFCDTFALALQHSERELIELATDFFSKNLQKIILTVKWQSFLVKNPIQGNELLIKALATNK